MARISIEDAFATLRKKKQGKPDLAVPFGPPEVETVLETRTDPVFTERRTTDPAPSVTIEDAYRIRADRRGEFHDSLFTQAPATALNLAGGFLKTGGRLGEATKFLQTPRLTRSLLTPFLELAVPHGPKHPASAGDEPSVTDGSTNLNEVVRHALHGSELLQTMTEDRDFRGLDATGEGIQRLADHLFERRDEILASAEPKLPGFKRTFARAAGAAVPGFAAFAAALATGGPYGAALLGFLEGASEGDQAAFQGAVLNWLFAKSIPLVSRQHVAVRTTTLGATGAVLTSFLGGPHVTGEDILAQGLIMGSLGLFGNRLSPEVRNRIEVEKVIRREFEAVAASEAIVTQGEVARMPTVGEVIAVASEAARRVREGQPSEGSLPGGGGSFAFRLEPVDQGWRLTSLTTQRGPEGEGTKLTTSTKTWKTKPAESTVRKLLQKQMLDAADTLERVRQGLPPKEAPKPKEAAKPKPAKPPAPRKPAKEAAVGTLGDRTVVRLPSRDVNAEPVTAHYALREADDLIASHRADNFQERSDYPKGVQERAYHRDQPEQVKVLSLEERFDPRFVHTDTPTATDGPPIVTPSNLVAGGNGRTMAQQRIYSKPTAEDGAVFAKGITPEELKADVIRVAGAFGLDARVASEMKKPILVRLLEMEPATPEDFAVLVRRLNESFTQTVKTSDRGVANAKSMSDETKRVLVRAIDETPKDAPTIRQALESNRDVVKELRNDGIIRDQDLTNLVSEETGFLKPKGLDLVEDMLLGWVVGDANVLDATPGALRQKLIRVVPALIRVDAAAPALRFRHRIQAAVKHEISRNASNMSTENYLLQSSIFDEPVPPAIGLVLRSFNQNPNALKITYNRFAKLVEDATSKQDPLFGDRSTVEQAFMDIFGEIPGVEIGLSLDGFIQRFGKDQDLGVLERDGSFRRDANVDPASEGAAWKLGDEVVLFRDIPAPQGVDQVYQVLNGRGQMPPLRQQPGQLVREPPPGERGVGPAEAMPLAKQQRPLPPEYVARAEADTALADSRHAEATYHPDAAPVANVTPGDLHHPMRKSQVKLREESPGNFVPDVRIPKKPIKQENVLAPLLRAFQMPANIGRISIMFRDGKTTFRITKRKGDQYGGLFIPRMRALFSQKPDIGTVSHEFGHFLADRFPELKEMFTNADHRQQILEAPEGTDFNQLSQNNPILQFMRLSYDVRKANEGFAEAFRLWATEADYLRGRPESPGQFEQPPAAKLVHDLLEGWVEGLPKNHGRQGKVWQKALRKFQREAHEFYDQGSLAELKSYMGETQGPLADVFYTSWDAWRQRNQNDFFAALKAERFLFGEVIPDGPYQLLSRLRGMDGIRRILIEKGVLRFKEGPFSEREIIGEPLVEILSRFGTSESDLELGLLFNFARQAKERLQHNAENLVPPEVIEAGLLLETPLRQTVGDVLRVRSKQIIDFAVDGGLLSRKVADSYRFQEYMWGFFREGPFRGEAPGGKRGDISSSIPIRRALGGVRNVIDPLQSLVEGPMRLIQSVLENEARLAVADKILNNPDSGGVFGHRLPTESKEVKVHREQIRNIVRDEYKALGLDDAMVKNGMKLLEGMEDYVSVFMGGQTPAGGDVMTIFRKGQPEHYRITGTPGSGRSLLLDAMVNIRRPGTDNIAIKFLNAARRMKQASIIYDPAFAVANFSRDTVNATFLSRNGFVPLRDSYRGMKNAIQETPAFWEAYAHGASGATLRSSPKKLRRHALRMSRKYDIPLGRFIQDPLDIARVYAEYSMKVEEASRMGEFLLARQRGKSAGEAAFDFRDVATDFGIRGSGNVVNALNKSVIFFHAANASFERLYRAMETSDPRSHRKISGERAHLMMMTGMTMLTSMALAAYNLQIEEYRNLPPELQWAYWHFYLPAPWRPDRSGGRGSEPLHLMFPKTWEIGSLASMAERMVMELPRSEDPETRSLGLDLVKILGTNFALGLPQLVQPLFEQARGSGGVRSFSETPIVSPNLVGLGASGQTFRQRSSETSATLGYLAEATRDVPWVQNVNSPQRVEALLNGYFGIFTSIPLALTDKVFFDAHIEGRLDRKLILSRFYRAEGARERWSNEWYSLVQEWASLQKAIRDSIKNDLTDEHLDELEDRPLAQVGGLVDERNAEISELTADLQELRTHPELTPELTPKKRRTEYDKLLIERNRLYKESVQEVQQELEIERQAQAR